MRGYSVKYGDIVVIEVDSYLLKRESGKKKIVFFFLEVYQ